MKARSIALIVLLFANSTMSLFGAVDLVTLPRREGTQLTIYNSEDITMVREHRLLTVKPGINRIQFSWANTLIDPTSIDFRILDHVDKVDLLDTTFPSGRNDALQWNIRSGMAGKIPVEIRYFTSGITWKADYVGIANQGEDKMGLTGYVRVLNNSGELYDNAEVRLVVGNINLVEKIADLASRPPPGVPYPAAPPAAKPAMRRAFLEKAESYSRARESRMLNGGMKQDKAKDVRKQGLSEYFLFTIEGREDIKNKEPKRLVSMKITDVPLAPIYKLTDRDGGQFFTKYYRFKNKKLLDDAGAEKKLSAMENLGESPLPDGMVRLFSEYDNQDLAYVGGTATKYVPIGDRVEVNVGRDSDITMMRRLKDQRIENVVSRQYKRRIDDHWVMYYDHIDYDETFVYEEEIVSGKAVDAKLEVERRFAKDVTLWGSEGKPRGWDADIAGAYVDMHEIESRIEKVDQNHVKYFLDTRPGQRWVLTYTVTYKHRNVGPELNQEKRREPLR
ncbi:MAG: hypothetical protein QGH42_02650 [Kiritimatiellia bacterium]|jgi:hypothetical protein|nr:hypothetical protein [Kiritimatiellia bacterium]MDP6811009.1 hypothetical protein [Kiritimatiellia bacterium]MDP7023136.1 hypothetical protein [Kiritimatiellia bacterium]